MRLAIHQALKKVPAELRREPEFQALDDFSCTKVFNIIQLIYQSKSFEKHFKDYEFGLQTMQAHWNAGLKDMQDTLKHPNTSPAPRPSREW